MSKRKAVIIRQLAERPVAHAIMELPDDQDIDDPEHYFESEFERIKEGFCSTYVEFKDAKWYWNEV